VGEPQIPVGFRFVPGVRRAPFTRVRLTGNWDEDGHASTSWSELEMTPSRSDDGGEAWAATVLFDPGMVGRQFRWGVRLDGPQGEDLWGIPEPAPGREPWERHRDFVLKAASDSDIQLESYLLTGGRHRGCRKLYPLEGGKPGLGFAVWAPHAWKVEVVFLNPAHGYVADDGTGLDRRRGPFELTRGPDDVWRVDPTRQPALADFEAFEGRPYMYRVTLKGGKVVYRTDMYSRAQAGQGEGDPEGAPYLGTPEELDGTVSGSLVVDPDVVFGISKGRCSPEYGRFPSRDFWRDELRGDRPRVENLSDLVIYEMHVGALGSGTRPGTLADATAHLDHLADLGVNAVELMPVAEFDGWASWGYGSSHPMAIEASAGGRHQLMHFVREAHRRGLLVLVDVVYNHFSSRALRAAWQYDSREPEENIYYWYEGASADYTTPRRRSAASSWPRRWSSSRTSRWTASGSTSRTPSTRGIGGWRTPRPSPEQTRPAPPSCASGPAPSRCSARTCG
jgi:1,4-alpha-glucan branching enzyme